MTSCPLCGGEIRVRDDVELVENVVSFRGKTAHLTGIQTVVLELLLERYPRYARQDEVIVRLESRTQKDYYSDTARAHVFLLKNRIRPLGLGIDSRWGRGWKLEVPRE